MLDAKALGLSLGILWTVAIVLMGVLAMTMNYSTEIVNLLGTVYKGYGPSWPGIAAGVPWAFADAFIGGYLVAWLYNKVK